MGHLIDHVLNVRRNVILIAIVALGLAAGSRQTSAALVAHYGFDDAFNLGLDQAGNDNNGTAVGADAIFSLDPRVGAGSLALDGSGFGLVVDNPATFQNLTTFSIAGFVRPEFASPNWGNGGTIGRIFGAMGADTGLGMGTNDGYGFGIRSNDGGLRYTTYAVQDYDQPASIQTDVWQHIAVVVTEGSATFYRDGVSVGTIAGNNPTPTANPFHIGASAFSNSDRFVGLLDDLRIYDNAIDATEVATLAIVDSVDGDFDDNLDYDCADIDALIFEIAAQTNNLAFDLTGDNLVTIADRDAWLDEAGAAEVASGNPYLIGDEDLDGTVDSTDLGRLLNNFNATTGIAYCGGDLTGDSNVDSTDLGLLLNNFNGVAAHAAAVPEPEFGWLIFAVLIGVVCRRKRK